MRAYGLYLESGPKHRKTMVHVPELLGCVAVGPTTEEAIAAAPEAITAFRRFLARHGQAVDTGEVFEAVVVEHITEGYWLGNGDPSLVFETDLEPLTDEETANLLERFSWLRGEFASWAERQTVEALDAATERGRTNRKILLHVIPGAGGYLSAALGGATGFSRLQTQAERGEVPIPEALRRTAVMASERVWQATPEERAAIRERPNGDTRTLRKALRRMLEHDWEHLAELSRRPGGPVV